MFIIPGSYEYRLLEHSRSLLITVYPVKKTNKQTKKQTYKKEKVNEISMMTIDVISLCDKNKAEV